jgi:hypothetical protein
MTDWYNMNRRARHLFAVTLGAILAVWPLVVAFAIFPRGFAPHLWLLSVIMPVIGFVTFLILRVPVSWNVVVISLFWCVVVVVDASSGGLLDLRVRPATLMQVGIISTGHLILQGVAAWFLARGPQDGANDGRSHGFPVVYKDRDEDHGSGHAGISRRHY